MTDNDKRDLQAIARVLMKTNPGLSMTLTRAIDEVGRNRGKIAMLERRVLELSREGADD